MQGYRFEFKYSDILILFENRLYCLPLNASAFLDIITHSCQNQLQNLGHLAAIDAAFDALDKAGYEVLGAYLSPAHGCYSESKLKANYIPSHHRMEMCFLACDQRPRLNVDTWEMMQDSFNSFVHAMPEFYKRLKEYVPFLKDLDFTVSTSTSQNFFCFLATEAYTYLCIDNLLYRQFHHLRAFLNTIAQRQIQSNFKRFSDLELN